MIIDTIQCRQAGSKAASKFLRHDDITLIVMPWLPWLSGSFFFRELGLIALAVVSILLVYAYCVKGGRSDARNGAVGIIALLMMGFLTTSNFQQQSFVQVAQLILVALAIKVGPLLRFTRRGLSICAAILVLLSFVGLIDLLFNGKLMFANANAYGVACLCWVSLLVKLFWGQSGILPLLRLVLILIISIALAIMSESRSIFLAIVVLFIWPIVTAPFASPKIRSVFGLSILLLPLALISLIAVGGLSNIQDLIPVVGDKSPFSGRDIMWIDIIFELDRNGYRGFGLGSLPGGILAGPYEGLSAHNGFLQIFYQLGVIGLVVFLFTCGLLIVSLTRRKDSGISVAILVAALVHEMFEVVLLQNHFGPGLLLWLTVTLVSPLSKPVRSDVKSIRYS